MVTPEIISPSPVTTLLTAGLLSRNTAVLFEVEININHFIPLFSVAVLSSAETTITQNKSR